MASSTECGGAGLTTERLDQLDMAVFAISDQRVDLSISDPVVWALLVRTGEALGIYAFGCSSAAFDLAPGAHRCRCKPHNRRVGAGEAAGGAVTWGAWLEETLNWRVYGPSS